MADNGIDIMEQEQVKVMVRPDHKPEVEPQYVVIIGDSMKHTFEFVQEVCVTLCGMNGQQAALTAKTIHTQGQAPVWKGSWDQSVLKRDQIRSKGGDERARAMNVPSDSAIPCWIEEG